MAKEEGMKMSGVVQEVLGNEELRKEYFSKVIEPTFATAEPFFQKLIEAGEIRSFDPALAMRVLTGTALGILLLRMLGDPLTAEKWDELPDVTFDILFNGLAALK